MHANEEVRGLGVLANSGLELRAALEVLWTPVQRFARVQIT
jgi:hypothetical protein